MAFNLSISVLSNYISMVDLTYICIFKYILATVLASCKICTQYPCQLATQCECRAHAKFCVCMPRVVVVRVCARFISIIKIKTHVIIVRALFVVKRTRNSHFVSLYERSFACWIFVAILRLCIPKYAGAVTHYHTCIILRLCCPATCRMHSYEHR